MSGRFGRLATDETKTLKEGFGVKVGQDFYRSSKDEEVEFVSDVGGGNAKVKLKEGRFSGQTGIVPKSGLK